METFWVAVDELITCLIAHLPRLSSGSRFRIADTDGRTHGGQIAVCHSHKLCVPLARDVYEGTDAIRSVHETFLFCLGDNVDSSA